VDKADAAKSALRTAYSDSRKRLNAIAVSADSTQFKIARSRAIIRQIDKEIARLDLVAGNVAKVVIPEAYGASVLKTAAVAGEPARIGAVLHRNAINTLVAEMTGDLQTANAEIGKFFTRTVRASQQKILADKQLSKAVAQGLIEGETRKGVSNNMYDLLKERLGKNQSLTINGRNYDPRKYADLVARTRTREAASHGTINTCLQVGMDLVRISQHANASEICQPFEGNIYSISGSSKEYPKLEEYPPYHPNCRHIMNGFDEETVRRRKAG